MLNIEYIINCISAILHYRSFRNLTKRELKNQHAIIHCCIIVIIIFGGIAAFASHMLSNPPIPHLYTLHSWIGLLTIILFLFEVSKIFILPYKSVLYFQ